MVKPKPFDYARAVEIDKKLLAAAAREFGRRGGKSKSKAKAAAARRNGRLGGRPLGTSSEIKNQLEGKSKWSGKKESV